MTLVSESKQWFDQMRKYRESYAKSTAYSDNQSYVAKMNVDRFELLQANHADDVIAHVMRELCAYEKDLIYKLVVGSPSEWTTVRTIFQTRDSIDLLRNSLEVLVRVDASPAISKKVYIPVYEYASMPSNVHKCSYCGGYTVNDKRGHCSGCGGPRNDDYIKELNTSV